MVGIHTLPCVKETASRNLLYSTALCDHLDEWDGGGGREVQEGGDGCIHIAANGFSRSHVWMWELDHKEGWVLKNWCFQTVEKTLKSPLDCKEIKPVNPKGNQSWIVIGRTDAEAPILWPPDVKSQLTGKDCDAGKDWRQEEKGTTEDEMVR